EQCVTEAAKQITVNADLRSQPRQSGVSKRNRYGIGRERDTCDEVAAKPSSLVFRKPPHRWQVPEQKRFIVAFHDLMYGLVVSHLPLVAAAYASIRTDH